MTWPDLGKVSFKASGIIPSPNLAYVISLIQLIKSHPPESKAWVLFMKRMCLILPIFYTLPQTALPPRMKYIPDGRSLYLGTNTANSVLSTFKQFCWQNIQKLCSRLWADLSDTCYLLKEKITPTVLEHGLPVQ